MEKICINDFDISDIDFLIMFNYPGNKLLKCSVRYLMNSGSEYIIECINSKQDNAFGTNE